MGNKKTNGNRQRCNSESRNAQGFHNSRSRVAKRKSKQNQQLFMNDKDYRTRLQEVLYSPEHIFTKIFRKDGTPLGDQFDSLPSNAFLNDSRRPCHEENHHTHKRRKVSMHAILDYETCCENSSPALRHGIGKGPMTLNGPPLKGKGLMTLKSVLRKNHGNGKGLMTDWQDADPDATDFPYLPYSSEKATPKKKKRVQPRPRESILKKLADKEGAKKKTSLRSRKPIASVNHGAMDGKKKKKKKKIGNGNPTSIHNYDWFGKNRKNKNDGDF